MEKDIINQIPSEILLRSVIANNLKQLRKKHGLTQEELANISGLHRVTIAKYEKCKLSISLITLLQLAKVLGEPVAALLDGYEEIDF